MANLFGYNFDIPGVSAQNLNGIPGWQAALLRTGLNIANPDVDLIPGVGLNEAGRVKGVSTGGPAQANRPQQQNASAGYAAPTVGTGGGYNGAPSVDTAAIAQTQSYLDRLGNQQNIGQENIDNSFNASLNKLLSSKAVADRDYNTNKTQSTQDNIAARTNIDASVGRNANALQRLLGARGSGNSSASQVVAPYAAALQGTQARGEVQNAFGRNMQALDTSYNDFNTGFGQSREDLDRQKFQQDNALRADIATKRQTLLARLAELNGGRGAGDANALGAEIDNLGRQYAGRVNVNAPTYTAPELAQYNYEAQNAPQMSGGSAYNDTISPALALLLGKKDRQQGAF